MKHIHMLAAAGLVAASLGVSAAPAQAPGHPARVVTTRTVQTTRVTQTHRRGWHKPHCWTKWRHHHRVRVCR